MRRVAAFAAAAVVAALLPVASRAATREWNPPAACCPKVAIERDVEITMPDGVVLHADVRHPAGANGKAIAGRFPVLLTQTPYNREATGLNFADDYLVEHGFVQVIVDVRGTGASDGQWDSFGAKEQSDSVQLVRWAVAQRWSNGNIALHGTSYGAINQFLTAARTELADPTLASHIKAMFPIVPMSDAYRDITDTGGQIDTSFIPSWLGLVTALGLGPYTTDPKAVAGAYAGHAQGAVHFQATTVSQATLGNPTYVYDGPFYQLRSPVTIIDHVHVPTFIVGGWYDLFQRGEPLLFQRLQANGVPSRLLMGPWYHITAGNGLPTPNEPYTADELELRWLEHWVNGAADDFADVAPVTYWHAGGADYGTAPSWPPPGIGYSKVYLTKSDPTGAGGLSTIGPGTAAPDMLPWQPASGVCTRSSVQWTAGAGSGTPCETDNEANDRTGLMYDLPVPNGMQLAGPVAAHLYASTNGRDAFLTVRVEDVDANGSATQISAGWQTLSLSALDTAKSEIVNGLVVRPYHDFTQASQFAVKANHVYDLWIEVFPIAATLAPGHHLRLAIEASDAPHLTPDTPETTHLAGGILRLYHDASHPSMLVVPVQPG